MTLYVILCCDCYSIVTLCHCLLQVSIQCCRYKHCLVVSYCDQLSCNVPSCKAHLYRRAVACHLISSAFRIPNGCCLQVKEKVGWSCSTIRSTCDIYQILSLARYCSVYKSFTYICNFSTSSVWLLCPEEGRNMLQWNFHSCVSLQKCQLSGHTNLHMYRYGNLKHFSLN